VLVWGLVVCRRRGACGQGIRRVGGGPGRPRREQGRIGNIENIGRFGRFGRFGRQIYPTSTGWMLCQVIGHLQDAGGKLGRRSKVAFELGRLWPIEHVGFFLYTSISTSTGVFFFPRGCEAQFSAYFLREDPGRILYAYMFSPAQPRLVLRPRVVGVEESWHRPGTFGSGD
jgi:hypothetical protein